MKKKYLKKDDWINCPYCCRPWMKVVSVKVKRQRKRKP